MKNAVFHPEARAEIDEALEFYEERVDGLGLRFVAAVEDVAERICASPEAGAPVEDMYRR